MYRLYYELFSDNYPFPISRWQDCNTIEEVMDYISKNTWNSDRCCSDEIWRRGFKLQRITLFEEKEVMDINNDPRIISAIEKGKKDEEESVRPYTEMRKADQEKKEEEVLVRCWLNFLRIRLVI